MKDKGAKAYHGNFKTYRGRWCPSYYEQRQKVWVAGDHAMVDRCARACDLDADCTAFTYVERSAKSRDLKVADKGVNYEVALGEVGSSGGKGNEDDQLHTERSQPTRTTPEDLPDSTWMWGRSQGTSLKPRSSSKPASVRPRTCWR